MRYLEEVNYSKMMEHLNELCQNHKEMELSYIGKSVFDRPIPLVTIGDRQARKSVLYVSTHHANENVCTSVMLNFIKDYFEAYERFAQMYRINMRFLYKTRRIYIIPMLNPDGVEYRLNGVKDENPIRDRVIAYNGGEDFSAWSANGRGVDLNHNYDAYFEEYKKHEKENGIINGKGKYSGEYAESEPEIAAIANFIRYNIDTIDGVVTLHTQGEEIYYSSNGAVPLRASHIAGILSRQTGYCLGECQGASAMGGLSDWIIKEFNKPSFTVECGKGENPLPKEQIRSIYTRIKESLFTFPILF